MIGRLLGIDHGNKRLGLAVSDASGLVASTLTIIHRTTRAADFALLQKIIVDEHIVGMVIGMPYAQADTTVHTHADTVRLWLTRFQDVIHLPIIEWDEHLTSADAKEIAQHRRRKFGEPLDDLSAMLILQSYLDAVRDGLAQPPPPQEIS